MILPLIVNLEEHAQVVKYTKKCLPMPICNKI